MEEDEIHLDLEELRYKHIILRGLQKTAIKSIENLEIKNLSLTNENIELKVSVQKLTESASNANRMMVNAITNNNTMKDDYRNRIQELEKKIKDKE